ncbi:MULTISPECIES: HsdM family class I SAM-dependent methyltransferase [Streptomyces]|uniref:HsdM family class I SAM-dependent methyltransferase n=1 Tax=Streptomyces TaxID=1883 RepID=UPI001E488BA9|nr:MULTISPECIES: N-6 DNA methylase [Streptomyces]UFQ14846.1 SAM-dependent methyltransferase [Streptomyces huasconensis]WCL84450.1 N-6 DNA methylase [Streptomyces sp. JCM 35825]
MATERDSIGAKRSERDWTAETIFRRWQRFYELKTSAKALTRLEFTEHIAYLLFLKLDHERTQRAGMFASQPIAPAGSWSHLVLASGEDLHRVFAGLLTELGQPNPHDPRRAIASVVFQDSRPWPVDRMAELGRLIIEEFDPYKWSEVSRDELGAAFSALVADCRDDIRAKRETGQFLTPPHLLTVVAKALALTPQDRVIDAAVGVGTSLIAAHREMAAHGGRVDAAAIAGADIDVQMCRLATMNVLLNTGRQFHDVPPILRADSLKAKERAVRRYERDVAATVAICNPPFRSNVEADTQRRDDFWAQNAALPANFLQHLAITLPQGARAAVFVPDGVLFQAGAAATIRRTLLKNCNVHTLLRLPTGMFHDTGSKSNILFFTKSALRPSGEPATEDLWVYDLRDRHHRDTESPLTEEDFAEFLQAYRPGEEGFVGRTESQRFKRYDCDAVRKILDSPLASLNLKADLSGSPDDFGNPRDIAQSIVDHLDDAQRSFQAVLNSLS